MLRILYPNWSNASEFKETSESFDTVAIHNMELHEALMHEWENRIDKTKIKLTSDQKYMREQMDIPLLFCLSRQRRRILHLQPVL